MFSVQRIKFECLAYIKEFGSDASLWHVGACRRPDDLLAAQGVDREHDIWLWKPAASPVAARTVVRFLIERMGARQIAGTDAGGDCVVLYRKMAAAPRL